MSFIPQIGTVVVTSLPVPPKAATWGQVNWRATTTIVDQVGGVYLSDFGPPNFGASENLVMADQPLIAAPWTLTALFIGNLIQASNSYAGIFMRDGGVPPKVKRYGVFYNAPGALEQTIANLTNPTTFSANIYVNTSINASMATGVLLRMQNDTVNFNYSFSTDGLDFQPPLFSEPVNSFLTPTRVGIAISGFGTAGAGIRLVGWNLTSP